MSILIESPNEDHLNLSAVVSLSGELVMSIVGGEIHEFFRGILRAVVSAYYRWYSMPSKDTFGQVGDHSR